MAKSSLTPVESSQIAAIGFDPSDGVLTIQFKSGSIYDYRNFTQQEFEQFAGAESIGSHFYKFIKPYPALYPYKKRS